MELALAIVLGVWSLGSGVLYVQQDTMLHPGSYRMYGECDWLKSLGGATADRTWDGQRLRTVTIKGAKAKATLLYFHGNGDTVCTGESYAKGLSSPDWDLVLPEYPGYGGDDGKVGQERMLANALAVFDILKAEHPERPVLVFGLSLGTGVATYLASKRPVTAMVLHTPYPSINDVANQRFFWLPVRWLNRSPFPAQDWAKQVDCPVLAMHGTKDHVIFYKLGKQQAANFKNLQAFETFEGGHHMDLKDREPERYWGTAHGFFRKHLN